MDHEKIYATVGSLHGGHSIFKVRLFVGYDRVRRFHAPASDISDSHAPFVVSNQQVPSNKTFYHGRARHNLFAPEIPHGAPGNRGDREGPSGFAMPTKSPPAKA